MASAVYLLTRGCGAEQPNVVNGTMNKTAKIFAATAIADVAILLTAIVLVILKDTAIIAMPAAAYYTLMGIAGIVALLHIITAIETKCGNLAPACMIIDWCGQSCAKNNQSEKRL